MVNSSCMEQPLLAKRSMHLFASLNTCATDLRKSGQQCPVVMQKRGINSIRTVVKVDEVELHLQLLTT